jgi:hypothetical protein
MLANENQEEGETTVVQQNHLSVSSNLLLWRLRLAKVSRQKEDYDPVNDRIWS